MTIYTYTHVYMQCCIKIVRLQSHFQSVKHVDSSDHRDNKSLPPPQDLLTLFYYLTET